MSNRAACSVSAGTWYQSPGPYEVTVSPSGPLTVRTSRPLVITPTLSVGWVCGAIVVPVEDYDDVATLHERIKVAERAMLVASVGRMAREGFTITGRRVRFGPPPG